MVLTAIWLMMYMSSGSVLTLGLSGCLPQGAGLISSTWSVWMSSEAAAKWAFVI